MIRRNVNKLGAAQNVNRCIYLGRADCPVPERAICRFGLVFCRWLFEGRGSLPRPLWIHLFTFWAAPNLLTVASNHATATVPASLNIQPVKFSNNRGVGRKTDRLFSLVIKTKVVQNVNRMSKSLTDRPYDRIAGQLKYDKQSLMSLPMKTKIVHHVPRINIKH